MQGQLENRRRRRRFPDAGNNANNTRPLRRLAPQGAPKKQLRQLTTQKPAQPKVVTGGRKLKVRNLDEAKVSNDDLRVSYFESLIIL